eukprot:1389922-Amorphochlora_amoeboformis.AAC.2
MSRVTSHPVSSHGAVGRLPVMSRDRHLWTPIRKQKESYGSQESSGYGGVRNDTEKNEKRSRRTSIKLIQEKQLIQELKQWTDEQFGMAHQDIPGEENLSISDSNLPNEVAPETGLKVKGVNLPVSPTADPAEVKDAAVTWSPWSTMPGRYGVCNVRCLGVRGQGDVMHI